MVAIWHYQRGIIPANTGRITFMRNSHLAKWDHPREYGENIVIAFFVRSCWGSSPRIRGECFGWWCFLWIARIIPANTGRIAAGTNPSTAYQDHPREYGENQLFLSFTSPFWGSSPRIRGEFSLLYVRSAATGIIPANTGRM